jgi:serine/threonine protein kinase
MNKARPLIAGRYQQLALLGQGGMGPIWLGLDTKLRRSVALREVVAPDGVSAADLEKLRPRFLREAQAAARLNHPNVVRVYDIVINEGSPWIIMEYLPSHSLAEVIAERGPMPPEQAAQCGLDVLAALTAAHRASVLHRDVKPGNVLIAENNRTVLTDFGLATIVGDPALTRADAGSPAFMAPERAAKKAVGPAADLWSLGATLYFAVEGHSPYDRPSVPATLTALATDDPPFSAASGPLWPVLEGLLQRDPAARLDATTVESMLRSIPTTPDETPSQHETPPQTVPAQTLPLPPPTPPAPARPTQPPPLLPLVSTRPLLVGDLWADDSTDDSTDDPTADPSGPNRRRMRTAALAALALGVLIAALVWLLPPIGNQPGSAVPDPSPSNPGGAAPGASDPGEAPEQGQADFGTSGPATPQPSPPQPASPSPSGPAAPQTSGPPPANPNPSGPGTPETSAPPPANPNVGPGAPQTSAPRPANPNPSGPGGPQEPEPTDPGTSGPGTPQTSEPPPADPNTSGPGTTQTSQQVPADTNTSGG